MNLRIVYPKDHELKHNGVIEINDEDFNEMSWGEAKSILADNYNIKFKDMAVVLRTQNSDKDDKQMIELTMDETVLKLNDDNVLFMSASAKIKSGILDPKDYPNTVAGLKLLVKDMQFEHAETQNKAFKEKLNQISSLVSSFNDDEDEDESNDLLDEFDSIFSK